MSNQNNNKRDIGTVAIVITAVATVGLVLSGVIQNLISYGSWQYPKAVSEASKTASQQIPPSPTPNIESPAIVLPSPKNLLDNSNTANQNSVKEPTPKPTPKPAPRKRSTQQIQEPDERCWIDDVEVDCADLDEGP